MISQRQNDIQWIPDYDNRTCGNGQIMQGVTIDLAETIVGLGINRAVGNLFGNAFVHSFPESKDLIGINGVRGAVAQIGYIPVTIGLGFEILGEFSNAAGLFWLHKQIVNKGAQPGIP